MVAKVSTKCACFLGNYANNFSRSSGRETKRGDWPSDQDFSDFYKSLSRKERGLSSNFNLQTLQNSIRFEILPYLEVLWNVFALPKLIACIDMSNQFAKLKHLRYRGHSPLVNVLLISLISLSEEGLYIILYQCDESKNILTQLEESWHQYLIWFYCKNIKKLIK